jgi:uncharacterized RDD family membrane protein YckC
MSVQPARGGPKPGDSDPRRVFVTPEGVDLRLKVGSYVERALAAMLDGLIIVAALVVLTLLCLAAAWGAKSREPLNAIAIVWMLGSFVLRVGYFAGFEMRAGAATPGKRRMGLRVIARDGGRLTADAVFARNALRELEVFLPLTFLLARGHGVDAALIGLGALWSGVFVVFPLFNRDRLRLGDLAAGTMVVHTPRTRLARDLAEPSPADDIRFSETQLNAYGVKELQLLEEVLRAGDRRTMREVAQRIRRKIAWDGPQDTPDRGFLAAYYAALRSRLETSLLFGRRRADKHDVG